MTKRPKAVKVSEAEVLRAILQYLSLVPHCYAIRINSGALKLEGRYVRFNSGESTLDIMGVAQGKPFAIEVKSSTGRLKAGQLETIERIKAAGGLAFVARSIDDVEAAFTSFGITCPLTGFRFV